MTALAPCPFCRLAMIVREHSAFHPAAICYLDGHELDEADYAAWNTRALLPAQRGEGDDVERVARAMVAANGFDPEEAVGWKKDGTVLIRRWQAYRHVAQAAIAVLPRSTEGWQLRYERLLASYGQLQGLAQAVINDVDNNLDTKKPPFKFTAPWGTLADLRKFLLASYGLRAAPAAGAERNGEDAPCTECEGTGVLVTAAGQHTVCGHCNGECTRTPDATITSTVERCAVIAQEECLDIGTASTRDLEVVRRTRDAIAARIRALAPRSDAKEGEKE